MQTPQGKDFYWNTYRVTFSWTLFHHVNIMGRNHYWTNQEIGSILCSWRFNIGKLVHGDVNAKKEVLL